MNLLLKEPVTRVKNALNIFDKSLEIIELNSTARTALDAANALNCEVGAIVKSLLFKAGDSFVLCLVSGDKRCSLNKLLFIVNILILQLRYMILTSDGVWILLFLFNLMEPIM